MVYLIKYKEKVDLFCDKNIKEKNYKELIKSIIFYLKVMFKVDCKLAIASILGYTLVSIFPAVLLYLNKRIFQEFSIKNINNRVVLYLLLFIFITNIFGKIMSYYRSLILVSIGYKIRVYFEENIYNKLLSMEFGKFDDPNAADMFKRMKDELPGQSSNIVSLIFGTFSLILQIVASCSILWSIHLVLPIVLIVTTFPYMIFYQTMNFKNYFMKVNHSKEYRKDWYFIRMLFEKNFNKDLIFNNLFDYISDKERDINYKLHEESYTLSKKYAFYGIILDIIKTIVKVICIVFVIYLVIGGLNISALTVLFQATEGIQGALLSLFNSMKEFGTSSLLYKDYLKFCNIENETSGNEKINLKEQEVFIELKNVSMRYSGNTKETLSGINLKIKQNEKIAIVGENGCGKTTLVNLILGFYKPSDGNIEIFGNNLNECLKDFRSKTVYVMQNIPHYCSSFKDNIFMNRNINNEKEINKFFDLFNLADIVSNHKKGMDSLLGVVNEGGIEISGGEWARLGLVRNCIKDESYLYILDEPTAALDPLFEETLYNSIGNITRNKTSIFISHRLGITKFVDRIVVLQHGKIIEEGTHEELMKLGGVYNKMFSMQKELYVS